MSKDKKYDNKFTDTNSRYKRKDIRSKSYKYTNVLMKKSVSEFKTEIKTDRDNRVVISRSKIARLYPCIDEHSRIPYEIDRMESSKKRILELYNIFSPLKDIICKDKAYRIMREISSSKASVITNISNSEMFYLPHINVEPHIKAYLYSMIYPAIFEVCGNDCNDLFFNKYPVFIESWCNMLEDAIITDGFMKAIHESIMELFDYRNDTLHYAEGEYSIDLKSKNHKNNLIKFYKPIIDLVCNVAKNQWDKSDADVIKSIRRTIDYKFFKAGSKGDAIYRYMKKPSQPFWDENFFRDEKSHFSASFSLYCLNRQTHIFDFFYHSKYKFFDFHLTGGFMTNYAIWYIANQNEKLISIINDNNNEADRNENKIHYICNEASQFYIFSNFEQYDFCFLSKLINQISMSFKKYELSFNDKRSHKLLDIILSTDDYITEKFYKFINRENEENHCQNIFSAIGAPEASSYYNTIYEDLTQNFS